MSIIRTIISLARSLHMMTTVEGVETVEQLDKLRDEGCTEVQGYIFGRPRPADELSLVIETPISAQIRV